mgnify:CR=1 FL=1|tara:strand:+ start:1580 stop:1732 length:153 start_codon:yes stop_codon:yes gene_type:complete
MKETIKLLEQTIKRIENQILNTDDNHKLTCLQRAKKEAMSSLVTLKYINK